MGKIWAVNFYFKDSILLFFSDEKAKLTRSV